MSVILQTSDLWRTFGGVAAVAGVDFELREGELRCLIGANGAGKSTFFKMLTGQLKPTSGRITLYGKDITRLPSFAIARMGVGIKTQVPNLFNGLSVHENLMVAARFGMPAREAADAVDAMLERIQMTSQARLPVGSLAHGHRQWVELGMILINDPRLVLLDEPAAGMTAGEVERTIALLEGMRGKRSFIIVEHDMHFIRRIAERVTVFHRGRVLVEDTMDEVVRNTEVRDAYLGSAGTKRAST
ncbi:ABC transporter ATP-binding protein [Pusillimonas noertemannii]|uniref:Branched-chain amino acid transport system ATP-binding protein/urea transport system ATP-binding protein n=1 Tax=Pusillimonas noertemannii TaxID=305977 RepID=A0A2U1CLG0_9BURK|nr:ABC transporter ATP-binding protein [Pusillimonas noertemannii]NYT69366.1 ABC transporter ATP-binding protein [Pusillimonas noertemannii]PVY61832.1 branched-chain amino acid transport system ATP-binding protein/urea transport system ATP-binding protein [Pusillimonas noertemannii]TFL09760.1 ABC transporter ATP-binding protein [Pusillimonas noertemannii]